MASGETWWRIAPALRERGWEVDAPDLPGHGGRPAPAGPLTLETLAEDHGRVDVLVGHSLGALAALVIAGRRPDGLRALVLEEPPGEDLVDRGALADGIEADVARAAEDPEPLRRREREANPRWTDGDAVRSTRAMAATDPRVAGAIRDSTLRWDLPALVAAAPVPVLVMAAPERRGPYPQEPGTALRGAAREALRELAPPSRFALLDGGHCLHRDDPVRWLATVDAFLGDAAPGAG